MAQQQRDAVLYFDGDADYVKVENNQALQVGKYTVEVWFKTDGIPDEVWKGIFGKAGPSYNIWLNQSGAIGHRFTTTEGTDIGPTTAAGLIKWGVWHHVAISNDGSVAKIYVDGTLAIEEPVEGALVMDSNPLFMGVISQNGGQVNDFKGCLTEVRLWDHVRSGDAIKTNMFYRLTGGEQGLVGYWPLNAVDQTSNVADQSENSNKGKVYGAIIESQLPYIGNEQGPDKRQYVLKLDGTGDYVRVGGFRVSSDFLTVACWAKHDSATIDNDAGLVAHGANVFSLLFEKTSGEIWFLVYVNKKWQKIVCDLAAQNIDIPQWHHYAGTYDGQSIRLYIDGEEVSPRIPCNGTIQAPNTTLDVGWTASRDGSGSGYLMGKVTDVQIWNKALDGGEIKDIMLHRLSGSEPSLQLYWPLNEGQGTVATDKTANAKNGRISGDGIWDQQFPLAIPPADADISAVIKNIGVGLVADVAGGQVFEGADVWGWQDNGGAGQKWTITPDGVITTHLNGGLALSLGESIYENLIKNVCLKPVDGSLAQQWEILPSGVIKNKSNGFVMTMEDYGAFQRLIWASNPIVLDGFNEFAPPAKAKWELVNL